jgi:hypothetical protein
MKNQRIDMVGTQSADNPRSLIANRLQEAIDELRADVAKVELWASALMTFAEPIPEYSPSRQFAFDRTRATAAEGWSSNGAANELANGANGAAHEPVNGTQKPAQQA